MNRQFKRTAYLFEMYIFVTFDQCYASLLNKIINFLKNKQKNILMTFEWFVHIYIYIYIYIYIVKT